MRARLSDLASAYSSAIIGLIGAVVFATGLGGQFRGDDVAQIVDNPTVHSLANFGSFFGGGTFYLNAGETKLAGDFYRPLMTTAYSLLYTFFGLNPFYFHLFQSVLCIASAIILCRVFAYSFKPILALCLAVVFLVHPANSQIAFSIPSMQDALCFFFGILAVWFLLRSDAYKSLFAVSLCLTLSLLSKETGILFVALTILYLVMFDRRRFFPLISIMALPLVLYATLKITAVGLSANPNNAPIDNLGLGARLLTSPSLVWFYFSKFLFPLTLASAYYGVNPTFTVGGVLLPLIGDLVIITLLVLLAITIRKRGSRKLFRTYLFYAAWGGIRLLPNFQIIPLDMSASETWLYFPMVGFLGMIGTAISVFEPVFWPERRAILSLAAVLLLVLGTRTALRGPDWYNDYTLAKQDITVSSDNFTADIAFAYHLGGQGDLSGAREYVYDAVSIYPTRATYDAWGRVLAASGDYAQAKDAFLKAMTYEPGASDEYEGLGVVTLYYGDPNLNKAFLVSALNMFPQDGKLWLYLAILEERSNDNQDARIAIANAASLGEASEYFYTQIMKGAPIVIGGPPSFGGD